MFFNSFSILSFSFLFFSKSSNTLFKSICSLFSLVFSNFIFSIWVSNDFINNLLLLISSVKESIIVFLSFKSLSLSSICFWYSSIFSMYSFSFIFFFSNCFFKIEFSLILSILSDCNLVNSWFFLLKLLDKFEFFSVILDKLFS